MTMPYQKRLGKLDHATNCCIRSILLNKNTYAINMLAQK